MSENVWGKSQIRHVSQKTIRRSLSYIQADPHYAGMCTVRFATRSRSSVRPRSLAASRRLKPNV